METAKRITRPVVRRAVTAAGRSYIAGERLDQAMTTGTDLAGRGYALTLGYWNANGESPDQVAQAGMAALEALHGATCDGYLSIKVPPLRFDASLYATMLDRARALDVPIHLDSHSHADAEPTWALATEFTPAPRHDLGVTLPARWARSLDDTKRVVEFGVSVRVVKGQWPDPSDPLRDARSGFLAIVRRLAGRARRVRIASHDVELARTCLKLLRDSGTPCELELLYGLPVGALPVVARDLKVPVRVYLPYGVGSVPYALRYLRENPRVLWWLAKDSMLGSYKNRFPVVG